MDERKEEPSTAEIKAERENRYNHSLAHGIEKARASRARTEALKNDNSYDRANKLYTTISLILAELMKKKEVV